MANLGTLWFGADIDLTALKQKIQSGNQSILDALKMNYDPASYQQMVNKLRTELGREAFEIKISTNASSVQQSIQNTINSISGGVNAPKIDLSGLKGIPGMTRDILDQREAIRDNRAEVNALKESWGKMINQYGRSSSEAMRAYREYDRARKDLSTSKYELEGMNIARGRAALAQAELNRQMKEGAKAAKQWNSDHMRLNTTLAGGIHVSTQLGSALSSLFAIDAARQFLGNVIEIGGQLEKQRISIGAILGDTVKASHLFEQIKGLALKSPFGVVELDQYTKQLSAYGFKYNELFDMTKRLADISAGAGTDIGRLTLALGHVRSATYLTGITLRQFSMNNIPMLKMLADYYTEVEKKAVSTAEVQQRISKRQVSYEDVIEQIRRLTDEGGMFYNMQEKISESLSARYKNLKDAMDIMYGEMAEGAIGDVLKGLATVLLKTTRHWSELAHVMGVAFTAFLIGKARIGLATVTMQGNTAATVKQILATKQLEANNLRAAASYRALTIEEKRKIITAGELTARDISQSMATKQLTKDEVLNAIAIHEVAEAEARALVTMGLLTKAEVDQALATSALSVRMSTLGGRIKNAFAGVGWGTWATIGTMVGMELYSAWDQWNEQIDEKANEMKDLLKSRINDLQKMQKELDKEDKPKDQTALKARVDEMKQVLANSGEYTKTIDDQLSKTGDLNKHYDILAGSIEKAAEKNRKALDYQDDAAKMIKKSKSDFEWLDILKAGILSPSSFKNIWDQLFNNDIKQNIEDLNEAYKDLRSTLDSLYEFRDPLKEVVEEMQQSFLVTDDLKAQLKDAPFEEQLRLIVENGYWNKLKSKIEEVGGQFNMSEKEIKRVCERLKDNFEEVADKWGKISGDDIPKMYKVLLDKFDGDEKRLKTWAQTNVDDFKLLLDSILDQLDQKVPAIRNQLKRMTFSYVMFGKVEKEMPMSYAESLGAILDKQEEKAANIKDEKTTTDTKNTDKSDKKAKELREQIKLIKDAYSWYKKYKDELKWSPKDAFDEIKKKYGDTLGLLGIKWNDEKKGISEYKDSLQNLLTKAEDLYNNKGHKNSYMMDVIKELKDALQQTDFDEKKEEMQRFTSETELALKILTDQWNTYNKVLDITGNRNFAIRMTGFSGINKAEAMRAMIKGMASETDIDFGRVINMDSDDEIEKYVSGLGLVGEKAEGIAKALKEWRNTQIELKNEAILSYSKIIADSSSIKTEIEQINKKYDEQIRKLQTLRDLSQNKPGKISENEYNIRSEQLATARKLEIGSKLINVVDFGETYELFGKVLRGAAIELKEKLDDYLSDIDTDKLSVKEYIEYTNIQKKLKEYIGGVKSPFDKTAWTDINTKAKALQTSVSHLITDIFELDNAKEEERKAEEELTKAKKEGKNTKEAQAKYDKAVNKRTEAEKKVTKTQKDVINNNADFVKAHEDAIKGLDDFSAAISNITSGSLSGFTLGIANLIQSFKGKDPYKSISELLSGIGGTSGNTYAMIIAAILEILDSIGDDAEKFFHDLLSSIFNAISGLIEELASGKLVGLIVGEVINGIGNIIQGIGNGIRNSFTGFWEGIGQGFGINNDDDLQEIIEESKKQNEILQYMSNMLDKSLERTLGGIYATKANQRDIDKLNDYKAYSRRAKQNLLMNDYISSDTEKAISKALDSQGYYDTKLAELYLQRDELKRQLSAEEDKKDSDSEQIEGFKEQIQEIEDQIEYFAEDLAKSLYSIDIKSWASQLGDALFDAWKKGEDGAEAFAKKAKELIADVAKNMVAVSIIEEALEPLLNDLKAEMKAKGGKLDSESISLFAEEFGDVMEWLPSTVYDMYDKLDEEVQKSGLGSMKDDETSSSSSSAVGRSITEEQANILVAITQTIRADVSVIRLTQAQYLPTISDAVNRTNVLAEAQVGQLQQIAANTSRNADAADKIYSLLHNIAPDGTKLRIATGY